MTEKPPYEELEKRVEQLENDFTRQGKEIEDLKRFIEKSQDVIYRYEIDENRFVLYNKAGYELYGGKDGKTLTPKSVLLSVHSEDRDRVRKAATESLSANCNRGEVEYRQRHADGSIRWMHDRWRVIRDPFDRPIAFEGIVRDITERKGIEKALHYERDLLSRISDTSPAGITVVNRDGRITFANRRAEEVLGLTNGQITHRAYNAPAWHITDGNGNPFPDEELPLRRVIATARPVYDLRHAIEWPDGSRVLLSINAAPLFDDAGQVDGMVSSVEDITKRVRAEDALRENEKRFRGIVDSMADWIWEIDANGRYTYCSEKIESILGYSPAEIIGKTPFDLMVPDEAERVGEVFGKITAHKEPIIDLENWNESKDGRRVCLMTNGVPVLDENGSLLGYIGVDRDITDRKRAEEALRESEEKLRTILEANPDPIVVYDKNGHPRYLNPEFTKLFGWSLNELKGNFIPFVPENQREITSNKIKEIYEHGDTDRIETKRLTKEGKAIDMLVSAAPIKGADEKPSGLVVCLTDISKTKELEDQIRQAHKMEAIGTLAGGIAHEFNNILGIIIGNTELAIDDVPEWNPAKDCLKEIRKASLRAKDVVRQILSFARKTPATRKPIKISTIIKESMKLIRATIPTSIEIRQEILCDSEMILANPTEISQILINFCSNSIHAMEDKTGVLVARLETVTLNDRSAAQYEDLRAGKYVKLTVKDSGDGVDPEIMDRIFDPYFTTKEVDKGLGMGLAVVFGLVKKHDGAIKFTSEVGKGSTAAVLFPIAEVQTETEMAETDDLPTGTERILLVDDEASIVKMVTQMLERQGYEVVGRTSSKEALELFQEEPGKFDLIITDMAMPDMTGDRLTQELINLRPNIPIILCTGHSDRIDKDKAEDLGIKAYTIKPLDMREFTKMIREVLDKTKI
jgi:PAS domain S-box-containing protein